MVCSRSKSTYQKMKCRKKSWTWFPHFKAFFSYQTLPLIYPSPRKLLLTQQHKILLLSPFCRARGATRPVPRFASAIVAKMSWPMADHISNSALLLGWRKLYEVSLQKVILLCFVCKCNIKQRQREREKKMVASPIKY